MAPIFDTDLAEERWAQAEWENYELWEKLEQKARQRRRLWIVATAVLFMMLSSVPVIRERWDKWVAESLSRRLAVEIGRLRRDAAVEHVAFRLSFKKDGGTRYSVERLESCSSASGTEIRTGSLLPASKEGQFQIVSPEFAQSRGIPGLVTEVCYDPLAGLEQSKQAAVGIGLLPAKDLSENRIDRLSILLFSGPSAEMSFD